MNSSLPADLAALSAQLDAWRGSQRKRARIPDHFYHAAVRLLDHCSVATICRETRLRPASLRKHAAAQQPTAAATPSRPPRPDTFLPLHVPGLDLLSPSPGAPPATPALQTHGQRLLLERSDGARLTITLASADWERITALCQSFLRAS